MSKAQQITRIILGQSLLSLPFYGLTLVTVSPNYDATAIAEGEKKGGA